MDLFTSKDKIANCETFIENYDRTRRRHIETQLEVVEDTEGGRCVTETPGATEQEPMIMDLDQGKFKKKDHIFMDFFSMYGKSFI